MPSAKTQTREHADRRGLQLVAMSEAGVAAFALPDSGRITIGRGDDGLDVKIDDASLSRVHAALHLGTEIHLEDLGSSNGTFLRGERLAVGSRAIVRAGAYFELAEVVCVLRGSRGPAREVPVDARPVVESVAMRALYSQLDRAASSNVDVLLLGETGVGKEVFATELHARSARASKPFVKVSCATIAAGLAESELFGHERGAFTGADRRKLGLFEAADEGTVFLDEIGELDLAIQSKLLRVLEERRVRRVGGVEERTIDVRIVAATNRDLAAEVATGRFREDLFFRLGVFHLQIPPLRQRREEIGPLAQHFIADVCTRMGLAPLPITAAAQRALAAHTWPGNLRELRNMIERAVVLADDNVIDIAQLSLAAPPELDTFEQALAHASGDVPEGLDEAELEERAQIIEILARTHGNQTRAAESLGISRRWLTTLMTRYRIARPRKRT